MLNPLTPLASSNLGARFQNLYQQFQNRYSLTFAGKFSIPLNPILGGGKQEMFAIARQKTNLQCFVALDFTQNIGTISLGNAQLFTFESDNFESIELSLLIDNSEELLLYLRGYLKELLGETGITIQVLSESPRGYSLGFSGTFAGILAEGIYKIKHGEKISPVSDLYANEFHDTLQSPEKEITQLAHNIEKILKPNDTISPISFQTLFAEGGSSVFFVKQGRSTGTKILERLDGISHNLERNFDYGVIYSGIPMQRNGNLQDTIQSTIDEEKVDLLRTWSKSKFNISFQKNAYRDAMLDVLAFENLEFLRRLDAPISHPESSEIGEILRVGNKLARSFEKLDGSSHFLDHLWGILEKQGSLGESDVAILPIYTTSRGGSYIWYGKKGIARKNLYNALEDARKRYPELNLIFDGSGICNTNFVYFPEVRMVSDYRGRQPQHTDTKKYILCGRNSTEYVDEHDVKDLSYGKLLIDQISRKIFINGEKVNSKEILSQQLTIDLIEKYIVDKKAEIHASELPSSSYTQNKNEMMSKIVHPLIRTIHKRLGKEVKIACYGSALDFSVRFDEFNIDSRSLKKEIQQK